MRCHRTRQEFTECLGYSKCSCGDMDNCLSLSIDKNIDMVPERDHHFINTHMK